MINLEAGFYCEANYNDQRQYSHDFGINQN